MEKSDFDSACFVTGPMFQEIKFTSEEECISYIRQVNQHNRRIYKRKKLECDNLRMNYEQKGNFGPKKTLDSDLEQFVPVYDISFYLTLLKCCPDFTQLPHYLPKRRNPDFLKIMNLLLAEILKETVEIQNFVTVEELMKEEKDSFLLEIREKQSLMNELIRYRDTTLKTVLSDDASETLNTLIYLTSPSGNYYAYADEKKIDAEYYQSFLGLLESLKDGTFKNIKHLTLIGSVNGLLEVKDFKTRIIFQRVERDIYCVLGMFMKKVDTDAYYRRYLETRYNQYKNSLNQIKNSLKEPTYLEENKQISLWLQRKWRGGSHENTY